MRSLHGSCLWTLALLLSLVIQCVSAGFLNVQMQPATQCGHSIVQWSGDDGPYHLLLTPTEHEAHGYNVWLPSLPNGTNTYNLSINQPQGLQFILTMWGASGISYAGTTDILTVGAPLTNASCFFTDQEILGLYSFSFNISDTSSGYPPQCSNLTMSWPTSLESNVTGTLSRREDELDIRQDNVLDTTSSSDNRGNTTYPPSMFGVIPLGNSFSIPITYDRKSKYAKYLPESSRSDNPTTWTSTGVTYLNWTVPLAKGTRFILVAGIGSDQQWASGGSSALLTVGQGSTGCAWVNEGDTTPSVTATTGTYTNSPQTNAPNKSDKANSMTRTVLACVFSVLATLVIVALFVFCRKARSRRRQAAKESFTPYVDTTPSRKLDRHNTDSDGQIGTPLDLIASRDGSRSVAPILTSSGDQSGRPDSPVQLSPGSRDRGRLLYGMTPPHSSVDRSYTTAFSPPTSPTGTHQPIPDYEGRQSSLDRLLPSASGTVNSPGGMGTFSTLAGGTVSTHRPLMLHNRSMGLPFDTEEDEMPDLKREVLALPESASSGSARRPVPGQRRRRTEELEYVVHRDAGRVRNETEEGRRVLELPPRYEELTWEEIEMDNRNDQNGDGHVEASAQGR